MAQVLAGLSQSLLMVRSSDVIPDELGQRCYGAYERVRRDVDLSAGVLVAFGSDRSNSYFCGLLPQFAEALKDFRVKRAPRFPGADGIAG